MLKKEDILPKEAENSINKIHDALAIICQQAIVLQRLKYKYDFKTIFDHLQYTILESQQHDHG